MKCPHCGLGIILNPKFTDDSWTEDGTPLSLEGLAEGSRIGYGHCPNCHKLIVILQHGLLVPSRSEYSDELDTDFEVAGEEIIYPSFNISRTVATEVPDRYRNDFVEATSVLPLSPKASAALSRRILQDVLHEKFSIIKDSLANEISEFNKQIKPPTYLSEQLDDVRVVGNFAAHPQKDKNTGEIIDVETGEAEWLLDLLDLLFDFAFVQPQRSLAIKNSLNQKRQATRKP